MNFPNIPTDRPVAFDTETTGLNWKKDRAYGLSVAFRESSGAIFSFYCDLRDNTALSWAKAELPKARLLVAHHAKFDAHFSREVGIILPLERIDCTMIRAALIDEDRPSYALDALAHIYLQKHKATEIWDKLAAVHGGPATLKAQIKNMPLAPPELVATYACPDAELALELFEWQEKEIEKQELGRVCDLERRLLGTIIRMEQGGVPVDLERAETEMVAADGKIREAQSRLDALQGHAVNVNSTPQVKKIMRPEKGADGVWRTADGVILDETDGGGPSLGSDALRKSSIPEAKLIVNIRSWIKTRDVFLKTYILGHGASGRIHASFNQTRTEYGSGTGTGRFSITEPALQQMPARDEINAAIVRSCFIPEYGHVWGCWDWRQLEFRNMAHFTNEPAIIEQYARDPNTDFHSIVAEITGLPRDRDEKTGGANAKQISLGLCFGEGSGTMAREMGLPWYKDERGFVRAGPEAQEIFRKYHDAIPGIKRMLKNAESVAKARGYIKTPLGRHIRFPGGQWAHTAAGLLFQSTAADMMKLKMVELDNLLSTTDSRIMLTVHDEFDISLGPSSRELQAEITRILEKFDGEGPKGEAGQGIRLRVPIKTSYGQGATWREASR